MGISFAAGDPESGDRAVGYQLIRALTVDQLHGEEMDSFDDLDAENRHDVGVVQSRRTLGLAMKVIEALLILRRAGSGLRLEDQALGYGSNRFESRVKSPRSRGLRNSFSRPTCCSARTPIAARRLRCLEAACLPTIFASTRLPIRQ